MITAEITGSSKPKIEMVVSILALLFVYLFFGFTFSTANIQPYKKTKYYKTKKPGLHRGKIL
jgi:hypothetical protein